MKKMLAASMLAVCSLAVGAPSSKITASPYPPGLAYLTGNEYVQLLPGLRSVYVAGFLTGLNFGYSIERDSMNVDAVNGCIKDVPSDQLMAIVDDYIAQNPAYRDWYMSMLAFNAIHAACEKRGFTVVPR